MKVRMYADIPPYYTPEWNLYASSNPGPSVIEGWTRVSFDVDFPPDVMRQHDVMAPMTHAQVVERTEQ